MSRTAGRKIVTYTTKVVPSEAVALARSIEPELREQGRRRQAHGLTARGRPKTADQAAKPCKTRDLIAARCGMSPRTLARATAVIRAAENEPERFAAVARRMDETGNVEAAYRAILSPGTRRMLSQPPIFNQTMIGRMPLGEFSLPDIRWLVGFFAALGTALDTPRNADATSLAGFISEAKIKWAIARGDRMRDRDDQSDASGKYGITSVDPKRSKGRRLISRLS